MTYINHNLIRRVIHVTKNLNNINITLNVS